MEQVTKGKIMIAGMMNDSSSFAKMDKAMAKMAADGYEPVNPFSTAAGYGQNAQILNLINTALECDGVFMLNGWRSSKDLRIVFNVAEESGKTVIFQTADDRKWYMGPEKHAFIKILKATIHEVMGVSFDQCEVDKKTRNLFYSRMIFTYHCRKGGMKLTEIKKFVHRDHTTILHYLKKYDEERQYDSDFRILTDSVSKRLSENTKLSVEATRRNGR